MKKRVNLFSKKQQQQPIPVAAFTIRSYGLLFMCICVFLSAVAGGLFFFQQQRLNVLTQDLDRLERTMEANGEIQGSIVFFVNKKEQLKKFLKDDAHFEIYYEALNKAIDDSQTGAQLVSFSLTITRDTNFVIGFSDFESSQRLLEYIEDAAFLDNFDGLTLRQFVIVDALPGQTSSTSFQLSFSGKFKEVENAQN